MNLIKDLEKIAKEHNLPIKKVMQDFTIKNKEVYKKQYGIFLEKVNYLAIDLVRDVYRK